MGIYDVFQTHKQIHFSTKLFLAARKNWPKAPKMFWDSLHNLIILVSEDILFLFSC